MVRVETVHYTLRIVVLLARDLEKGGIDAPIGTIAECAAEAYRDGILRQLAAIVGTAALLYILNHVAGH